MSKLQRWILENCFRVTILRDRSWLLPLSNCKDAELMEIADYYIPDLLDEDARLSMRRQLMQEYAQAIAALRR